MNGQNIMTKTMCIFGGTGFIGRHLVKKLADDGWQIKVASRSPQKAYFLRPCGTVGQIVPVCCDIMDDKSLRDTIADCDAVVNLVGILYQKGRSTFQRTHAEFPRRLAKISAKAGIRHFVHISALGADKNAASRYQRTKGEGENAVLKAFPNAVILRPSVVFGPEDNFFNMFAGLAQYLPFLPLIGGGKTKFQPVYVGDVAQAIVNSLNFPQEGLDNPQGQVYELGGPEVLSFKEIYQRIFDYTGQVRPLIPLPWSLAKLQAFFMEFLPQPLLTRDQVTSLKTDNIVDPHARTLSDLGIRTTAINMIVPQYLSRFRTGGRFSKEKQA